MGLHIYLQPTIAFGFAFHLFVPAIELAFGPFIVIFGDIDNIDGLDDED